MMKAPSAEEVLALVSASTGPDGTLDPAVQQMLMQLQEQHALSQAQVHAQVQNGSSHPNTSPILPETNNVHVVKSGKTGPTTTNVIDLMPLSTAIGPNSTSATSTPGVATPVSSGASPPSETTSITSTPKKRKSIPLSMKKEAIQWIMGPGKGIPSRAEKHFGGWDVSASSFRKWWKNRDKILGDCGNKKRVSGGGRKPFLEDSEEKLLVVVIQERAKKDRVTRKWIAKTAQHMFQRSDSTFKASENWVTKFIQRNGLTLKRSYVSYEPHQVNLAQRQHQTSAGGAIAPTTMAATVPGTGNNVVV